jgi:hypothetical protein
LPKTLTQQHMDPQSKKMGDQFQPENLVNSCTSLIT